MLIYRNQEGKTIIGNCIFGSVPDHPFWKDVLDDLYKNPPNKKIKNKLNILKLTGPQYITRIYFKNKEKYQGSLPSRDIFHPISDIGQIQNYKEILLKNGSRGIHHCEGSWLTTKNPIAYLISKINSRLFRIFNKS